MRTNAMISGVMGATNRSMVYAQIASSAAYAATWRAAILQRRHAEMKPMRPSVQIRVIHATLSIFVRPLSGSANSLATVWPPYCVTFRVIRSANVVTSDPFSERTYTASSTYDRRTLRCGA